MYRVSSVMVYMVYSFPSTGTILRLPSLIRGQARPGQILGIYSPDDAIWTLKISPSVLNIHLTVERLGVIQRKQEVSVTSTVSS